MCYYHNFYDCICPCVLTVFPEGTCHTMECPLLDGQLRSVTNWLEGVEEMLGEHPHYHHHHQTQCYHNCHPLYFITIIM